MANYTGLVNVLRDDNACVSVKTLHDAADAIEELSKRVPAADVVPVVRCGECKHYDNGWCHRVHNPAQYSKTPDDWFCADGTRMDGDGE